MRYKKGYKYQVVETFETQTSILAGKQISVNYITLYRDGVLSIASGYASDGPSGITFDTRNFMRGAFVHDALL